MVCVCGAKAKWKLYWEVYNFQQAIKNTTSSPRLPLLAMLFLLRLKDLWKGERDKYNSHHKYPYAAGRLAGRQLFQLIYTHVCMCVCGRLGIGCGRTCETGMQSDSCVVLMQPQADRGRRQTSLTNVSYAYKAHLSHMHTPLPPSSLASFLRHFAVCLRQGEL